ncbi:MAG: type IV pilus modification protein PilV [Burkholderiales bacterium]|nr:MAG: type IV pilus modification protein PilV [Burkholderiales bacterium]
MKRSRRSSRGFTLLEVLIAVVVFAFGILGLARMQLKTSLASTEAVQRTQVIQLVQDMVDRIASNRRDADAYVRADEIEASGPVEDCTLVAAGAARDLCEWTNLLRGAAAADTGTQLGSALGARGCIRPLTDGAGTTIERSYVVSVAWQGLVPTAAPDNDCGQGQFDEESKRRVYSFTLRIANLGPVP